MRVRLTPTALSLVVLTLGLMLASFWHLAQAATAPLLKQVYYWPSGNTTQIVFDLSELPRDLNVQDTSSDVMTVSFNGHLNPTLAKNHTRAFPYANLRQVYMEERNGKVQVFIKRDMPKSVHVETDDIHRRVTLRVPNDISRYVAPGVRHMKMTRSTARGPWLVNVLEVDPAQADIIPQMAADKMGSKARVSSMVRSVPDAIAGINGSFFKQDLGVPLGILINDYELIAGPIYERAALGFDANNRPHMARISLKGAVTLPNNRRVDLDTINQPRVKLDQTVLYTSRWGNTAPPVPSGGYQVQLNNGRITAVSTGSPLSIPTDGYVISGPGGSEMVSLAGMPVGSEARLNFYTTPDWSQMKHAVGGGPFLVKNGRPYIDTSAENFTTRSLGTYEPRSAVGITPSGKLLMVTVDGRQKDLSVGASLSEMATLMINLGAVDAMNLDGGSSTQMVVDGHLVNSPSVRNGAAVSNGLIVRSPGMPGLASGR